MDADRRLEELRDADQRDRDDATGAAMEAVAARDAERRAAARSLLGASATPSAWLDAAVVLNHTLTPEDLALAHVLAAGAALAGHDEARPLVAATFDRLLHALGLPQRFGTQRCCGDLCRVAAGRLHPVDGGAPLPGDASSLPDGTLVRVGRHETRNPYIRDLPPALRATLHLAACDTEDPRR